MKIGIWKRSVLAVALTILVTPLATAQESRSAELEVGTASTGVIVAVTIDESITTSTKAKKAERAGYRVVRPGETVWGRVIGDTPLGDQGVIEAEARVAFTVGEAKKNRRMGRKGILVLEARLIQSERLGVIPVQGRIDSEGAGHKATAAALTYTLGPLGLLKRGKPAELPAGAIYQVTTVSGNVETFTSVRNSRRQQ